MFNRALIGFVLILAFFLISGSDSASSCVHNIVKQMQILCQENVSQHLIHVKAHECCQKQCSMQEIYNACQ